MTKTFRFNTSLRDRQPGDGLVLQKRRCASKKELVLIAADKSSFTDASGTFPLEAYRPPLAGYPVVMTSREADLIALANPGTKPVVILESVYPWLPKSKSGEDSRASYQRLISLTNRYQHLLETAAEYCDKRWNTICNKIRTKSHLDVRFYAAWHLPIQDVYVLDETRPNRSIAAIDFNSMYLACMQYPFPKPSALRHISFNRPLRIDEMLTTGLYRCWLINPSTDFIRRHNPFRSFRFGRYLAASMKEPIEVDLNEFEIEYYKRHFDQIFVADAVVSDDVIEHPLAKEALRSTSRRANYKRQGNNVLADREKYLGTLLASCASRPSSLTSRHLSRDKLFEHLLINHGILPQRDEPTITTDSWLQKRKGFSYHSTSGKISLTEPDVLGRSACFLFGQRIVARGRVILLQAMEDIYTAIPEASVCYSNIDSIHFSFPNTRSSEAMAWLSSQASDRVGSFKVESVTRHGLWLEPGRYWLYGEKVEKFKNKGMTVTENPWGHHTTHLTTRRVGDIYIPFKVTLQMERTMCSTRRLIQQTDGTTRQELIEVSNNTGFIEILDQLDKNRMEASLDRYSAFEQLRDDFHRKTTFSSLISSS